MKLLQGAALVAMAAAAGEAAGAPGQAVTGPTAVYWMSASTESGMGAGGPGGQPPQPPHRPSMAEMMRMQAQGRDPREAYANAYGARSGQTRHALVLQLGSTRAAPGAPSAEHDPPQTLGAGMSLPLVTPTQAPTHQETEPGAPPAQYQPQGRMVIYWGCGEHAAASPVVIDLADPAQGGAKVAALARSLAISQPAPPSPARFATYGEWPNAQARTSVPADGSLQGAHTVRGDYTPDISFTLAASQDFLPPIRMVTNQKTPSGAVALGWRPVDGAQGQIAMAFGSQGRGETVMWTSADVETLGFGLPDYLGDGEIARLVAAHVLMPASQTSCTVPVEVARALGTGAFRLVAYGGETNLSYPPRPPAPRPWHIDWQVKVRYRAATSGILGMDLERMMQGADPEGQPSQPPPRRNPFNPFGG